MYLVRSQLRTAVIGRFELFAFANIYVRATPDSSHTETDPA